MSLVYNEDQLQLQDSARDFLAARSPVAVQRALRDEGSALGYSPEVWNGMLELGWGAVAFSEQDGGLDFGFAGYAPLFEEIGRHLSASPLLSSVVLCGGLIEQLGTDAQRHQWLPALISGERRLALALEEGARGGGGRRGRRRGGARAGGASRGRSRGRVGAGQDGDGHDGGRAPCGGDPGGRGARRRGGAARRPPTKGRLRGRAGRLRPDD